MTITNFDDLQAWFTATKGGKPAPYWNLYGLKYGRTDQVVHRNVDVSDIQESARQLEKAIRMLSPLDEPARFKLSVYAEGQANNPTASVEVQIRQTVPATAQAGIAGLPAGVGSIQEYVNDKLETERLKWKIEQLEGQINGPSNGFERFMETLSVIPGIDGVLKAAVIGLVGKFNPSAMPAIQAAMNGTPTANGEHEADDDAANPDEVFQQNIMQASSALNTDPVTLSKKLNKLIQDNPELAKSLMQ